MQNKKYFRDFYQISDQIDFLSQVILYDSCISNKFLLMNLLQTVYGFTSIEIFNFKNVFVFNPIYIQQGIGGNLKVNLPVH
jgi:hypothetical protein